MAKKVIWSLQAEIEFAEILEYWMIRNKSSEYSEKLIGLFTEATELISQFPEIGQSTDIENVRHKLVRDYSIFYRLNVETIEVLTIWDNRQNPDKLKFK